jgi:hypothetical protein
MDVTTPITARPVSIIARQPIRTFPKDGLAGDLSLGTPEEGFELVVVIHPNTYIAGLAEPVSPSQLVVSRELKPVFVEARPQSETSQTGQRVCVCLAATVVGGFGGMMGYLISGVFCVFDPKITAPVAVAASCTATFLTGHILKRCIESTR